MAIAENNLTLEPNKHADSTRDQWAIVLLVWTLVGIFSASQL